MEKDLQHDLIRDDLIESMSTGDLQFMLSRNKNIGILPVPLSLMMIDGAVSIFVTLLVIIHT
jgi:hypothetical protein